MDLLNYIVVLELEVVTHAEGTEINKFANILSRLSHSNQQILAVVEGVAAREQLVGGAVLERQLLEGPAPQFHVALPGRAAAGRALAEPGQPMGRTAL